MNYSSGTIIGDRYHIVEFLGKGGMATVYKAYQENLNRFVAIKFLHPNLADDPLSQQRFRQEAQSVASLKHPNIVQIYDFAYENDIYYIVMEFVEGSTLEAQLSQLRRSQQLLSLEDALRTIRDLGQALAHAHARGIIHRDIKPGNVMVENSGRVVLMDFGLARLLDTPHLTVTGLAIGTPSYMAPEQIKGQAIDTRADIYSLGVLCYQLVTGRLPFAGDSTYGMIYQHLNETPLSPQQIVPDVPYNVSQIILKALAKNPDKRYLTIEALLDDLATPELAVVTLEEDKTGSTPTTPLTPTPPNYLPSIPSSFIGREQELLTIQEKLRQSDIRLLTLIGPSGTGKTRLALHVTYSMLSDLAYGAFFVDLTTLPDPALLPDAIARLVGLTEEGNTPLEEQLQHHLHERQLLLVLDNFEHMLEATPFVSKLLQHAPLLKILATSREPLRLYGENLYQVAPLALPNLKQLYTPTALSQFPSIRLFMARAQAVEPDFALTDHNARQVAELCVHLDGLPLAIELAAAQIYTYTPAELVAQLNNRLGLLSDGPRDRSARQQTMRGAIEWSYNLLPPEEQALFDRLGVLVGKFNLAAAAAIVGNTALASLVTKNLLQQENRSDGSFRYSMLQLLRSYALEQLMQKQELAHWKEQHANYFLTLAEQAEPYLTGPEQAHWFDQLAEGHDNFRAALDWSLNGGRYPVALALTGILWRLWAVHSHLNEGSRWLEKTLNRNQRTSVALRAKALLGAGRLAFFQNRYKEAQGFLEECLALYQALRNQPAQASVLNNLGELALDLNQIDQAHHYFEEALLLYRDSQDRRGVVRTLNNLGQLAFLRKQYEEAEEFLLKCLTMEREAGTPEGLAVTLNSLGEVARIQGKTEDAAAFYQESLDLYGALNYPIGVAVVLHNLGCLELQRNHYQEAVAKFKLSLIQLQTTDEHLQMAKGIIGLGRALFHLSDVIQAVRLFGKADMLLEMGGGQLDPFDAEAHQNDFAQAQTQLKVEEWQAAWQEGYAMPLEKILGTATSQMNLDA